VDLAKSELVKLRETREKTERIDSASGRNGLDLIQKKEARVFLTLCTLASRGQRQVRFAMKRPICIQYLNGSGTFAVWH